MPTWTFECTKCGNEFEELLSKQKDFLPCPNCGGKAERIITPCAIKVVNDNVNRDKFFAKAKKEHEVRNELFDEFGVDRIGTVYNKSKMNVLDLQKELREHSGEVKEAIAKDAELTKKKVETKLRKFGDEAWARRSEKIKYFKAQEHKRKLQQQKKNKIVVQ